MPTDTSKPFLTDATEIVTVHEDDTVSRTEPVPTSPEKVAKEEALRKAVIRLIELSRIHFRDQCNNDTWKTFSEYRKKLVEESRYEYTPAVW